MKRRLFTILSALSLLLCITGGVMWCRSYGIEEAVCYRSDSHRRYIISFRPGRICAETIHEVNPDGTFLSAGSGLWAYSSRRDLDVHWDWESYYTDDDYLLRRWNFAIVTGLRLTPVPGDPGTFGAVTFFPATAASIPYWFPMFLAAVPPILATRRLQRQRHRRRQRLCIKCGYDLRASPQRCPECGTPAAEHSLQ